MAFALKLCAVAMFVSKVSGDTCGDGTGEKCGSWFSTFSCPGTCCHDDFNTWCCPKGPYECAGVFSGGSHCDDTADCRCTDSTFYVTKVQAAGTPTIEMDPAWDLSECCDIGMQVGASTNCGWGEGTQISWTRSQSVSWSESLEKAVSVTFKESLLVEGLEVSISLKDTYTKGASKTSEVKQSISSPCGGAYDTTTYLHFTANVALYTVPVTITYENCGATTTAPGTITSTVLDGNYDCTSKTCVAPTSVCDKNSGCVSGFRNMSQIALI